MNHYETLGVERTATTEQIKKAYRKLARQVHSDINGGNDDEMARLNRAYDCLSDAKRREQYDAIGDDSDAAERHEQMALQLLMQMFGAALQMYSDPTVTDFVRETRQMIVGKKIEFARNMERVKASRERLTIAKARLRRKKPGDGPLHGFIDNAVTSADAELRALEVAVLVCKKALAMIDEYESIDVRTTPTAVDSIGKLIAGIR